VEIEVAFGEVLRQLRTNAGLSQEELANQSGLHRTYISLLERGLRMPGLSTIFVLAKPLNTTPDEMVLSVSRKLDQK
jgi:transcriptional regulator with XRE-family HTH domain